jgi:hypothetical protein
VTPLSLNIKQAVFIKSGGEPILRESIGSVSLAKGEEKEDKGKPKGSEVVK